MRAMARGGSRSKRQLKKKKNTRRKRNSRLVARLRRALVWTVGAGLVLSLLLVVPLRWIDPPTSAFMLRDRLSGTAINQRWVEWQDIGWTLPIAVIASEDQNFPVHFGFDLAAVREALEGGASRGASTISQQVAKNLYLWPGRSWVRKGIEAWLTLLLEATWPKQRILEVYLNIAEFGPGLYGVGAASAHFFGTAPDRLSLQQAARLATVLPSPARIDPTGGSAYVNERADWIVEQVTGLGGPDYLAEIER